MARSVHADSPPATPGSDSLHRHTPKKRGRSCRRDRVKQRKETYRARSLKDNTGHFINLSLLPAPARSVWQISRPGAGRMFRKVPEQQLQKFIFYNSLFNCKNKQYIPPELNKLMTINSDTLRDPYPERALRIRSETGLRDHNKRSLSM